MRDFLLKKRSNTMSEDYRSMWQNLGLDLVAHDALLGILGNFTRISTWLRKTARQGWGKCAPTLKRQT
jgi:hypothetical protein